MSIKKITFETGALAVTVSLFLSFACGEQSLTKPKEDQLATGKRPEYYRVIAPESSPVRGNAAAPVTIVTFADFQAPRGPGNARALKELVTMFAGKLRIVYRANPQPKHPDAMRAETAVRAAARQGKFWQLHDAIFEQGKLGDANITNAAKNVGCDIEKLRQDMDDPNLAAEIATDRQYALELGITKAPTNFINGRPLPPIRFVEDAAHLVKEELERVENLFPDYEETDNLYKKITEKGKEKLAGTRRIIHRHLDPNARYNIPVFEDDVSLGEPDAPVTIVAFVDLACPFSATTSNILLRLKKRLKKDIRLVFKHSPLPAHAGAEKAAEALMEAQKQGAAEAFHSLLLEDYKDLSEQKLLEIGEKAGLEAESLGAALADRRNAPRIQKDRALASKLGIKDTPYLFVNGKMARGTRSMDQLMVMVSTELKNVAKLGRVDQPQDEEGKSLTVYERLTANGALSPVYLEQGSAPSDPDIVNDGKYRVYNIPIPSGTPVLGNPDAPITVVEFGDYQCGMCASIRPRIETLMKELGDKAKFVFMHYPISGHEHAQLAAEAAVEAAVQGKFWKFHNRLMDHQELLGFDDLLRHGEAIGLDTEKLRSTLEDRVHRKTVKDSKEIARASRLSGTPSFYVNGRKLETGRLESEALVIIDQIETIEQNDQPR